ncbi:serine acetyltransferase [Bradyrhizobium sp. HKCCYLS3077]|uniref:serine acetyltransferase n=1 Tax=unclassified Bradyrhizobium TaxID=2631580 RepID=UPI003EB6FB40
MLVPSDELHRRLDHLTGQDGSAIADWSRERPLRFWDPGRKLLLAVRRYQYWQSRRGPLAAICCKVLVLRHRFWSVVTAADIPLNCSIGGGLLIPHPNGIVVHPGARIGNNCLLFQQVTIGSVEGGSALPRIGDHVDVGAGAKILGPVCVGSHARIGANAVITKDVEAGSTAFGINQSRSSQGERAP